jgi:hypothetical protein
VSPVRYELGFISQKTTFFIVTAVKTSNLTCHLRLKDRVRDLGTTLAVTIKLLHVPPKRRFQQNPKSRTSQKTADDSMPYFISSTIEANRLLETIDCEIRIET